MATDTAELITLDVAGIGEISKADAVIAQMAKQFLPMRINGPDDKEGYEQVHEARMLVKNKRVDVEKLRKELKAKSLEYGRMVDGEAKRIEGLILPIEDHLQKQEDVYNAERERLKAEAAEALRAKLQDRVDRLAAVGGDTPLHTIGAISDEAYELVLADATAKHVAKQQEAKRLRDEDERGEEEKRQQLARERAEFERQQEIAKAEQQRVDAEREAERKEQREFFERQQADIRAERERLAAEQRLIDEANAAIAREKAEAVRQEELKQARIEAAAQAEQRERERIAAEQEKTRLESEAIEAERKRAELLLPIKKRLAVVPDMILELEVPVVDHPAFAAIKEVLSRAATEVRAIVKAIR